MNSDDTYLGNYSAAPAERSVMMTCPRGCGWWVGCADAANCPTCGAGVDWWQDEPLISVHGDARPGPRDPGAPILGHSHNWDPTAGAPWWRRLWWWLRPSSRPRFECRGAIVHGWGVWYGLADDAQDEAARELRERWRAGNPLVVAIHDELDDGRER